MANWLALACAFKGCFLEFPVWLTQSSVPELLGLIVLCSCAGFKSSDALAPRLVPVIAEALCQRLPMLIRFFDPHALFITYRFIS